MSNTATASSHAPVRAEQQSPGYWRVTFDDPPFNLYDPEVESTLGKVVDQLETDPDVAVLSQLEIGTGITSRCGGIQCMVQLTGRSRGPGDHHLR
ncbi:MULTISPECIES: hypothetical protein [Streptomyces]|uniref:Uncharacterized protein n=1 Tax=Streptomyces flaveolus TaxID=67297 RepID=A0ABV3AKN4_9ACTN|nr:MULTISPECIES: hypothetical protein [Streptomyces]KOG60224.1 hypothetical protein ADK77_36510 [Streptomyces antibioticus]